jgi:hypothetical protein
MQKNNSPFSIPASINKDHTETLSDSAGNLFLHSPLAFILVLIFTSCTSYEREEFRMEVDKKYALKKFPDSLYLDTLDNFFKKEPIKKTTEQKAEITMQADFSSKIEKPKEKEDNAIQNQKQYTVKNPEKKSIPFADGFLHSLLKLSENPDSKEYGKTYKAKSGENIDELLLRIYGTKANKVPKNLTKSMLKTLNPNSDFNSFNEGEIILLPVVK